MNLLLHELVLGAITGCLKTYVNSFLKMITINPTWIIHRKYNLDITSICTSISTQHFKDIH
jgi:hypothetical protein